MVTRSNAMNSTSDCSVWCDRYFIVHNFRYFKYP